MWTTEHAIESAATPGAIWEVWADVPHWGEWNPDIERIEIPRGRSRRAARSR
jgi:Polyketide cyclase / dehydrase and lipid transport